MPKQFEVASFFLRALLNALGGRAARLTALGMLLLLAADWVAAAEAEFDAAADLYHQRDWAAAAEAFESLLEHAVPADRGLAQFYLAESLVQLGEYRHGHAVYSELARELDTIPAEMGCRVRFRLGETAYFIGSDQQATETLSEFERQYPDHKLVPYALPYLADLARRRNDHAAAIELYDELMQRFPASLTEDCRLGRADSLQRLGDLKNAAAELERLSFSETPRIASAALHKLAVQKFEAQQYTAAAARFAEFAARFPDDARVAETVYWRGIALYGTGDYAAAAKSLANAETPLARAHSHLEPSCWFFAAESFRHLGQADQARWRYQRLVEQAPEHPRATDARVALRKLREHTVHRVIGVPAERPVAPTAPAKQSVVASARSLIRLGCYREARDELEHRLTTAQDLTKREAAECQFLIAESYQLDGQTRMAAREYLRLDATSTEVEWCRRAVLEASACYESLGRHEAAARLTRRAKSATPHRNQEASG